MQQQLDRAFHRTGLHDFAAVDEKDRFVVFTADELKALEDSASHVVEIVAFIPEKSVDPIYYDKTYFIAPDKRGGKPYSLLQQALRESQRGALAKWASKGRKS